MVGGAVEASWTHAQPILENDPVMNHNKTSLIALAIFICSSLGGGGSVLAQDAAKGKNPKPAPPPRCSDIYRPCGTPGGAQWCACKEGMNMKKVECGCKPAATTGPSTSPGGSQPPRRP